MNQPMGVPARILSPDERKAILAQAIANEVAAGARVESQQDFQAVMVRGHRVNNVLHLILTLVTVLLWGIVWIIVALVGGEKRYAIAVDEYGHLQRR